MSLLLRNRAMFETEIFSEPLSDAELWIDFSNESSFTVNGSNQFTSLQNLGTLGGSMYFINTPVYSPYQKAFYKNVALVAIRYVSDFSFDSPNTLIGVYHSTDSNNFYYLGSGSDRWEPRLNNSTFDANFFGLGMPNVPFFNSKHANKHVFCLRENLTYTFDIYINKVMEDSKVNRTSGTNRKTISFGEGRINYSYSTGLGYYYEIGFYNRVLTTDEILYKQNKLMQKWNLI
jgi:hypothetical protein